MNERLLFSGLDEYRDPPENYRRLQRRHGVTITEERSFDDVLAHLGNNFDIEWRDLAYQTAETFKPVNHYRALINPEWEARAPSDLPDGRTDAVWHIPTKKYTKVAHHEVWSPLATAIRRTEPGMDMFGTCRLRRDGGEVHIDVFFESTGFSDDGDVTLGISTGHDYFGNTRLYVDIVAYLDPGDGVGQVMRYLVDPRRRKHTGDAGEEVVTWYEGGISRIETISETIYEAVAEAMSYEVPIGDMPCSISGFYEHLGLPNTGEYEIADKAASRAVDIVSGPFTAWHLYRGGIWALEHHYDARDTSSFKKHVTSVNMLLLNPKEAESRVLSSIETDITTDAEQSDVWDFVEEDSPGPALESVRKRQRSISEGVESFESAREKLRSMLTDEGVVESVPEKEADA